MSEQEDFGDCIGAELVSLGTTVDAATLDLICGVPGRFTGCFLGVDVMPDIAIIQRSAFITGDWSVEYPPIAEQSSEGYGGIVTRDVFPPNAMRAWSV